MPNPDALDPLKGFDPDIFSPPVQKLVPKFEYISAAVYESVDMPRPGLIQALDIAAAGTIYVHPESTPGSDAQALSYAGGAAPLNARGRWWVKHSGGAKLGFRVTFDASPGDSSAAVPIVTPDVNVTKIGGASQSAVDVSGKFSPRVLAAHDPDSVAVDDDNTVIRIPALVGRKFLYLRNIGLNACGLAFASAKASPVKGIILNPDEVLDADALGGITEEDIYAACGAGLTTTLAFQEGV